MPCGAGGKEFPAMQEKVADPDVTENVLTVAAAAPIASEFDTGEKVA